MSQRLCKKCGAGKTELVHHCSSCDKCVFLMDHHCWWTNNCVGYNSFKSFYLFSIYVMLLTIFGITTIIKNIYSTNQSTKDGLLGFLDVFSLQKSIFCLRFDRLLAYFDLYMFLFSIMLGGMAILMSFAMLYFVIKYES